MTEPDTALERRVLDLFQVVMDLPEGERLGWVERNSDLDSPLRARLLALIAGDKLADLRTGGARDAIEDERAPDRIGAYRIVERIGRGGMGAVYRGERMTGDFAHTAAIKLIKPGLLSERLVERFQRERQTLAGLSHPNIAQLFDGGATDTGDPYIVMELVDGVSLGEWIATGDVSQAARIAVFLAVCDAVGFAHQNLIVHRDITLSNILVTPAGIPKLIDFGIARPPAAAEAPDASSASKSLGGLSLTPGFAAPERVSGDAATTLGDIYSLGVVFDRVFPAPRDADRSAIVARATATDPDDRYPSADALADDVRAWRDGQPVAARGGGKRYALAKFVNRHGIGVAASVAALMLLVGALAFSLSAYRSAEAARQAEANRFGQVRALANYLLFDLNPRLERVVGNSAARIDLAARAQAYLSVLTRSRPADPALRSEAARGLVALAYIQGVPGTTNLGQATAARNNLQAAISIAGGPDGSAGSAPVELADALTARSMIEAHTDVDLAKAKATQTSAAALLDGVSPAARDDRWRRARSVLRRAELDVATLEQDADLLRRLADALEADIARWPARQQQSRAAEFDRASADYHRAIAGYASDELAAGLQSAQLAERRLVALDRQAANDPAVLYALGWTAYVGYGTASGLTNEAREARRMLDLADATNQKLLAIEPQDGSLRAFAANIRQARAEAFQADGRFAEALTLQKQVVDLLARSITREKEAFGRNRLAMARIMLSRMAAQAGDSATACAARAAAFAEAAALDSAGTIAARLAGQWAAERSTPTRCR